MDFYREQDSEGFFFVRKRRLDGDVHDVFFGG